MVTLTKKRTSIIVAAAVVAVLVIAIPLTAYALPVNDVDIASSRTLVAKGVARDTVNGEKLTVPANFTLTLQRAGGNNTVPRFNLVGGNVVINGISYSIASGNGGVLRGRHLILLKAQGTGPDGQEITLKLAGRYFRIGGRLYVARIGALLLTPNGNYTLFLRAGIRV